jgi:hypothetical protein
VAAERAAAEAAGTAAETTDCARGSGCDDGQRAGRPQALALMESRGTNTHARVYCTHREYEQTNLISDIAGVARITDPDLVNPWGQAASATSPLWVADNGADVSTLYRGGVSGASRRSSR